MSAIPPKADIRRRDCHVRFVPAAGITDVEYAANAYMRKYRARKREAASNGAGPR